MTARAPLRQLATHEVVNQPPPLGDRNLYDLDAPLREGLAREGAAWAEETVRALGAVAGQESTQRLAVQANRFGPELRAFDPQGRRLDEVEFHPAYHELMRIGIAHQVHSIAWSAARPGGHVAHAALQYLMTQAEAGVCCPLAMTYACLPTLRHAPALAEEWTPRVLSTRYDARFIPAAEKDGATLGMAMTEKQGGSDVRANTTRAVPLGNGGGDEFELHGHKWFCSAPMSDAFLTLANTAGGLTCFLVPRWRPDGERNRIHIQRLKDKLGNRSNASSEIEYDGAWARRVGEEGRGVRTIIEMVQHTRLDASCAPAGLMRQALFHAAHHAVHRSAFGALLARQPLMRNVLADLALEVEGATALILRVARSFDESESDPVAGAFGRIATAVGKYWINKRTPNLVYEAMECLGGSGYVEESILPRLYREAPVNSIWEGSGNVICLDVLRAMQREPASVEALMSEIGLARGADKRLDRAADGLADLLRENKAAESAARRLTERIAVVLQGALLVRHAPAAVADAWCATRLLGDWGHTYGTLPEGADVNAILARAVPSLA
jgi:putative acyl-CoA dehydrogenase